MAICQYSKKKGIDPLLKAYLSESKGFTLVELLIVIAIIAILVLIVIVAINPLQRIHDASDQAAGSDVRSVASAVEGCIARNDGLPANCSTALLLTNIAPPPEGAQWIRNFPANVNITGAVALCADGGGGDSYIWSTTTGEVEHVLVVCVP